ncbi:MAG: YcxB family protein [Candidatus Obscuribacter sp.]|nr:YcxB family protein [Candidatus Obscuribacter sp.]MBP6348789.1 YcxB family protein [Candidatus Obscuribacter sp.]MBP6592627.1 YcxB family protein [Candidatus Obscuribacter sp.]MBP7576558.1 YcxB family protein [Candidatus Obscuribacter sp.]
MASILVLARFGLDLTRVTFSADQTLRTVVFCFCLVLSLASGYLLWQWQKSQSYKTFDRFDRFRFLQMYSIAQSGFQFQAFSNAVLIEWTAISHCYDLPEVICFVSGGQIFPIPKRAFYSALHIKNLRNFVRAQGVAVTKKGKERSDIKFAPLPPWSEAAAIVPDQDNIVAQVVMLDADGKAVVETISAPELPTDLDLPTLAPAHPMSSLISEPIEFEAPSQSVQLEISYLFEELKKIDRMLFWKYGFAELCKVYIFLMLYAALAPAGLLALLDTNIGLAIFMLILPWTALSLPCLAVHSVYCLQKREEAIRTMIKTDQPVLVQLTDTLCIVRTRRSLMHYPWQYFKSCFATADHYICVVPRGSVIIPKRYLTNRIQAAFVEQLLRSSVQKYEEW